MTAHLRDDTWLQILPVHCVGFLEDSVRYYPFDTAGEPHQEIVNP